MTLWQAFATLRCLAESNLSAAGKAVTAAAARVSAVSSAFLWWSSMLTMMMVVAQAAAAAAQLSSAQFLSLARIYIGGTRSGRSGLLRRQSDQNFKRNRCKCPLARGNGISE